MIDKSFNTQKINNIQLHIYPSNYYSFHTIFYLDVFKNYSKGIVITIVQHKHPQHPLSDLPFCIVNQNHLVPKPKLFQLLQAIACLKPNQLLYFLPIYQLCQQIAGVGKIMSQQSSNPYYLLFSPYKKYQIYQHNRQFMKKFHSQTQYFEPTSQSLNKQQFSYKINTLIQLLEKNQKIPMLVHCVAALINSLKKDNEQLYQQVSNKQIIKNCQVQSQKLVNEIHIPQHEPSQPRYLYHYNDSSMKPNKNEKRQNEHQYKIDTIQKKISFLGLPIVCYIIFWKIHSFFNH